MDAGEGGLDTIFTTRIYPINVHVHDSPRTRREARPKPRDPPQEANKLDRHLRLRLGPAAHAEALATLRRYDQGLLSEKQVARAMDRLFHPSDHVLRDAFRYFLPAELAVE